MKAKALEYDIVVACVWRLGTCGAVVMIEASQFSGRSQDSKSLMRKCCTLDEKHYSFTFVPSRSVMIA